MISFMNSGGNGYNVNSITCLLFMCYTFLFVDFDRKCLDYFYVKWENWSSM